MDNKLLDCQVNNICEAFGCFEKAATKIKVRVGQLGTISLVLCTACVKKFDDNTIAITGLEQGIARDEDDKRRNKEVIKD